MSMMSHTRRFTVAGALLASLVLSHDHASAQNRDSLLNGAAIGGAIGAGIGIAFTHAVRDSDLTAGQYAYGGLVFGAIGAGAGLGVDALLNRSPRPAVTRSGLFIAPAVGRVNGVAVMWRWGAATSRAARSLRLRQLPSPQLSIQLQRLANDVERLRRPDQVLDDNLLLLEDLVILEEAAQLP